MDVEDEEGAELKPLKLIEITSDQLNHSLELQASLLLPLLESCLRNTRLDLSDSFSDTLGPHDHVNGQDGLRWEVEEPLITLSNIYGVVLNGLFGLIVERLLHHELNVLEPVFDGSNSHDRL